MPSGNAPRYEAVLRDRLLQLGYSSAFAEQKAAALAPLFHALARTDADRLFRAPDPARALSEFTAAVAPPEQFADAPACRSALDFLKNAPLPPMAEAERETPAQTPQLSSAAQNEADAAEQTAPGLLTPTAQRVRAAVERIRKEDARQQMQARREALFAPQSGEDETLLSERLAFAGKLCGRCPQDPETAARKLAGTDFSAQARLGSMDLIYVATAKVDPRERLDTLRWVVRLCGCYAPAYYPVSNGRIDAALRYFRDEMGFYPFREQDLQDYLQYKKVLLLFRRKYGLERFSLPELALYLDAEGKKLRE